MTSWVILEARGGIEPPIEVLQTSALPLGDRAPREDGGARQETLARGEGRNLWSGRRGSNPRLRPWQGRTLPLSYSRLFSHSTALAYLLTIHCTRTQPFLNPGIIGRRAPLSECRQERLGRGQAKRAYFLARLWLSAKAIARWCMWWSCSGRGSRGNRWLSWCWAREDAKAKPREDDTVARRSAPHECRDAGNEYDRAAQWLAPTG